MKAFSKKEEMKGFTLVELMIVVTILGVLAAIAIISYMKYVRHAKTSEAYTILGAIKAKQEAYRAEFSQYCIVSSDLGDGNRWPAGAPSPTGQRVLWGAPPVNWKQLGVRTGDTVYMGYVVTANLPGTGAPGGSNPPPVDLTDHWWAARAYGDFDLDGTYTTFDATNSSSTILVNNEGE